MYDKFPAIAAGKAHECIAGWPRIAEHLRMSCADTIVLCVECYPGVFEEEIANALPDFSLVQMRDLLLPSSVIEEKFMVSVTDDPVFGRMLPVSITDFFDPAQLQQARNRLASAQVPTVVLGTGASLVAPAGSPIVYADVARWTLQQRQRRNQISNLGLENSEESPSLKYKRAYFLDWRVADRLKAELYQNVAFVLDINQPDAPLMISGATYRRALDHAVTRPFRVVPFFDPGPWGGHWMERVCDLPTEGVPNYAWCFDCVPEENSLLLAFGEHRFEVPALNLVLSHPRELMGEDIVSAFGAEFPIRFDLLDTVGGGNLSLQVHPLRGYIREHFGMDYTQDESYYMLDAAEGACVYLGLKPDIDRGSMASDLRKAQTSSQPFGVDTYVNRFPAKKHDHFLIPAGTIHCSGKDSMVLEISATPYIFTFKLWDWERLGLDGRPRPVHLDHGLANIQWDRDFRFTATELVNAVTPLPSGDGWRAERTGLHRLEFIETVRHWFTGTVPHNTCGTVHVLNLVEGEEALVESPHHRFEPFIVHYAETFIVPANVGEYTIRPHGSAAGTECATIQASVRPAFFTNAYGF